MSRSMSYVRWVSTIGLSVLLANPAMAQVVSPDGTLNTTVNRSGNTFTITNGTAAGTHLFHSFREFSIPSNGAAIFDLVNTPNATTIFSRVTGGISSNIDGVIRSMNATNPVSLFLMNPAGIVFGPNSSLDITGSFLGTTASSISFKNGETFASTATPLPTPLLTVSVPTGLQFGQAPAGMTVRSVLGLAVKTGQTLGLVGGNLAIDGGIVRAPAGRLELGSVGTGSQVAIAPVSSALNSGFGLDYGAVQTFQDIQLNNVATVDASGAGGGAIQVQGRRVEIKEGSALMSDTTGATAGQGIAVYASEKLVVSGVAPNAAALLSDGNYNPIPSRIRAYVSRGATGASGNIVIQTPTLQILDGAAIRDSTYGQGNGGNITVSADRIEILGQYDNDDKLQSGLYAMAERGSQGKGGAITLNAQTIELKGGIIRSSTRSGAGGDITIRANRLNLDGQQQSSDVITGITTSSRETATGKGGDIKLELQDLRVLNGSGIRTGAYGVGNAGNIVIQAKTIDVIGIDPVAYSSGIFTTVNRRTATGKGGNIQITSDRVTVLDSAFISASTLGIGNSGDLSITSNLVEVAGVSPDPARTVEFGYGIVSSIDTSSSTAASAGRLSITANQLIVRDRGVISVGNSGSGNSGNLLVNANLVRLEDQGSLNAEVKAGSQGNITVNANALIMRRGASIRTNAGTKATGGDITLKANTITQLENSDIEANAIEGRGGNIRISTQALLGGKFRSKLTPESDITASSEFGINGTVQVNGIGLDPSSSLAGLPTDIVDSSNLIAAGCGGKQGSRFISTGRGGIPRDPTHRSILSRPWTDLRQSLGAPSPSAPSPSAQSVESPRSVAQSPRAIEATALSQDPHTGEIALIAGQMSQPIDPATCGLR